jgi:transcriptional regulator of heat shock response
MESHDFLYFDYEHVRTFINSTQEIKEEEKKLEDNRLQLELNKPQIQKMANIVTEVLNTSNVVTEQRFRRKSCRFMMLVSIYYSCCANFNKSEFVMGRK